MAVGQQKLDQISQLMSAPEQQVEYEKAKMRPTVEVCVWVDDVCMCSCISTNVCVCVCVCVRARFCHLCVVASLESYLMINAT